MIMKLTEIWSLLILPFLHLINAEDNQRFDPPVFDAKIEHDFSRGKLYYRILSLDEKSNSLYVGAMNNMYRLWMFNVNDTDNKAFYAERKTEATSDALTACLYRGRNPDLQCQNHVRVAFKRNDGTLYVCGTNAFNPQVTILDSTNLSVLEDGINGAAICEVDPHDNATAVWVENGNPDGIASVYSGTVTDFTQTNRIIYRPSLERQGSVVHPFMRTRHTDSKWLNEPQFVGSFDIGDFVYFFFREVASEYSNCGKAIYSRVARICKKDTGGTTVLKKNWATFLKARLNCSIPGEFPFYFDQIQHVSRMSEGAGGDSVFYGVFTTNLNGFLGSAVCSFSLRAIDSIFDRGLYKEQVSSSSAWLPVRPSQVPVPRPGQCQDTAQMTDSALHFVKSHLLMDPAVPSRANRPFFYKRDVILTKLAVDWVGDQQEGRAVIFAAAASGMLYKLSEWKDSAGQLQSRALAMYQMPSRAAITTMHVLKNEYLYVSNDLGIEQLAVSACELYKTCAQCTLDPYCSWNTPRHQCHRQHHSHSYTAGWLVSSPEGAICVTGSVSHKVSRLVYPGDTLHMPCAQATQLATWQYANKALVMDSRHLLTVQSALIILNTTKSDAGSYTCHSAGSTLIQYDITIDDSNCQKPSSVHQFQTAYREWCREFQQYKHTMGRWQEWYEQNTHCANAPHFKKLAEKKSSMMSEMKSNKINK